MTDRHQNLIVGCTLLLISAVWSAMVYQTIPPGTGEGDVGPRAFPLVVGLALGAFALVMIVRQMRTEPLAMVDPDAAAEEPISISAPLLTMAHIVLYGFLMTRIGFVLSTFVVVVSVMLICVRERSLVRIAVAAFGITLACWLLFGKLLGVYLPNGSLINLG